MPNTAQSTRIKLNLLYNQGVPQKLTVRLLKWLVSYGKFIVIVVDLLVIGAFAYRFKLDFDLSQINSRINTQLEFIESSRSEEQKITQFQDRLKLTETTYKEYPNYNDFFVKITSKIPQSIKLTTLSFNQPEGATSTKFKFSGQTKSNNDLSLFIETLKKEFNGITLDSIGYNSGDFVFTISGEVK